MPESPPVSPRTIRHGKRSRQSSKGETSISELSQEDLGYDGDVEVVRPDEVEEPESDFEEDDSGLGLRRLLWPDTDEELVVKLKRLGLKAKARKPHDGTKLEKPGSKRLSKEADPSHLNQHGKRTELEISEMLDSQNSSRLLKKRKESKETMAKRILRGKHEMQTSTSEETEGKKMHLHESSTAADGEDAEEMDLD